MYKKIITSILALILTVGSAGFVQNNNLSVKADEEDYPYSPDYSYDDYVADTFGTGTDEDNTNSDVTDNTNDTNNDDKETLTADNEYSIQSSTDLDKNTHKLYFTAGCTGTATFYVTNMYSVALYKEDGTFVDYVYDGFSINLSQGEYYLTTTVMYGTTGTAKYTFKEKPQSNEPIIIPLKSSQPVSVNGSIANDNDSNTFTLTTQATTTLTFSFNNQELYLITIKDKSGAIICNEEPSANDVPLSIKLNKGTYTLIVSCTLPCDYTMSITGKTVAQTNTITVTNSAAKDRYVGDTPQTIKAKTKDSKASLTYKSSNSKIVSISSTGKVTTHAPGKATITIKSIATDSYKAASKSYTIIVRPKMVSKVVAKRIKNTTKTATSKITWTKDSKASGYVLKYSTKVSKKNLVSPKTVKLTSNSKNSYTIKNIKIGKPIYISVRSYKIIDGKYYYGPGRAIKYIVKRV